MIKEIDATPGCISSRRRGLLRRTVSRSVLGAGAVGLGALACAWGLKLRPATAPNVANLQAVASAPKVASDPYGALYDPGFSSDSTWAPLARSLSLEAKLEPIPPAPSPAAALPAPEMPQETRLTPQLGDPAPLPPRRPAELGSAANPPVPAQRPEARTAKASDPVAPTDSRTLIQKLFGIPERTGPALAYATPESSVVNETRTNLTGPSNRYDRWTAVYDLAAHTVYLPNGTRLEAHSGLGDRLDDPRHVNERGRGATPPHIYELTPREQLFHGVQALRLNPVGDGDVFGRAGFLAHSYMLGPNGDSNGCVSFKDYDAFLRAYQNGQVKRLAVVARLD
jgi:hypothetical protein